MNPYFVELAGLYNEEANAIVERLKVAIEEQRKLRKRNATLTIDDLDKELILQIKKLVLPLHVEIDEVYPTSSNYKIYYRLKIEW
jgi:hypothetical protein